MAAHTKLWYLQRFGLLDVLSDAQKRRVAGVTEMMEVRRRDAIYSHGDPSDRIYLLKSGVVRISTVSSGKESILAFLHPGDIFGELAIVDDAPRDHQAVAHEDVVLCALSRDLLVGLIRETPDLGYRITKLVGLRLRVFRTRVEELLCRSAPARVARTLLDLAEEHGVRDSDGVVIPLRLTQRDLANLVGLTRETVNGIVQDFRQHGLVEADRRSIRLKDPAGLQAVR